MTTKKYVIFDELLLPLFKTSPLMHNLAYRNAIFLQIKLKWKVVHPTRFETEVKKLKNGLLNYWSKFKGLTLH